MKNKIEARVARQTGVAQESFGRACRITISGSSAVLVEGKCTLEGYEENCITASVRGGCVIIRGENLELRAMDRAALAVTGNIHGVELL